jgi:hypothetical protein
MFQKVYFLTISGARNGTLVMITGVNPFTENAQDEDEKKILHFLHDDWEAQTYGDGLPRPNPDVEPSTVKISYTATWERQRLYSTGFPVKMGNYEIISAFACRGSRFHLDAQWVFVEFCRSRVGQEKIWVYVYLANDPIVPRCTIHINEFNVYVDVETMRTALARHEADLAREREWIEEDKKEKVAIQQASSMSEADLRAQLILTDNSLGIDEDMWKAIVGDELDRRTKVQ